MSDPLSFSPFFAAALAASVAPFKAAGSRPAPDYSPISDSTPLPLCVLDPAGRISAATDTLLILLEYDRTDWLGHYLFEFAVPEHRLLITDEIPQELARTAAPVTRRLQIIKKSGEPLDIEVLAYGVYNGTYELTQIVLHVSDLSANKLYEDQIDQLRAENSQLRRQTAQVALAKLEFLTNLGHQLRTPLTGVTAAVELLCDGATDQEQRNQLSTLQQSADAIVMVVNNLLDLSRLEAGKLTLNRTPFDLRALVEETAQRCARDAHEKSLDLLVDIPSELTGSVVGDPERIRQVLSHLLENSIRFTARGESVLSVQLLEETRTDLRVRFTVTDTGIGIPKDLQPTIFDRFLAGTPSGSRRYDSAGTGLGLSICKRLAELMGGSTGVESEIGSGSTFWVELPLQKHATAPQMGSAAAAPLPRLRLVKESPQAATPELTSRSVAPLRVLLVEDNSINQAVARKLLTRFGHTVDCADSGVQALKLAADQPYDLIFMDIQMPELDGYSATRELRQREQTTGAHIPIIAMTAHAEPEDRDRCLENGMDDYIAKPIRAQYLRQVIERWAQ